MFAGLFSSWYLVASHVYCDDGRLEKSKIYTKDSTQDYMQIRITTASNGHPTALTRGQAPLKHSVTAQERQKNTDRWIILTLNNPLN